MGVKTGWLMGVAVASLLVVYWALTVRTGPRETVLRLEAPPSSDEPGTRGSLRISHYREEAMSASPTAISSASHAGDPGGP